MSTWQLQTAKARLSELLRKVVEEGPQTISVRGKEQFVVSLKGGDVPPTEGPPQKTLFELFAPLRGLGDDLEGYAEPAVREDREPFADDQ